MDNGGKSKMELKLKERRAVSEVVAMRYQRAGKKEKGKILDEFVEVTGYNRNYACWLLRNWGNRVTIRGPCGRVRIVVGER